jgi:hypothetical protein
MRYLSPLRWTLVAAVALALTFAPATMAQDGATAPGGYIAKGRWCNLQVRKDGGFSLVSIGANGKLKALNVTLHLKHVVI